MSVLESFKKEVQADLERQDELLAQLLAKPENELLKRPSENAWNAIECLEHLSLTYDYYLPVIREVLAKQATKKTYKTGWMMRWATQSLKPKDNGQLSYRMKTFPATTPSIKSVESQAIIDRFGKHHDSFKSVVAEINNEDQLSMKLVSLAGPMVKFKLGDAVKFILAHNARHITQAHNAART